MNLYFLIKETLRQITTRGCSKGYHEHVNKFSAQNIFKIAGGDEFFVIGRQRAAPVAGVAATQGRARPTPAAGV